MENETIEKKFRVVESGSAWGYRSNNYGFGNILHISYLRDNWPARLDEWDGSLETLNCYLSKENLGEWYVKFDLLAEDNISIFTKKDLKVGMLVETRNGGIYIVLENTLSNLSSFNFLSDYSEDLKCKFICGGFKDGFDIIRVYSTQKVIDFSLSDCELLWERKKETKTDWSKVAIDAKIRVSDSLMDLVGINRHFAKFEDGIVYAFPHGLTSFTCGQTDMHISWRYGELV